MQKNIGSRDAAAKNARVVEGKLLTGKSAVLRLVVLPTFHIYIDLLFAQLVQAENVYEYMKFIHVLWYKVATNSYWK